MNMANFDNEQTYNDYETKSSFAYHRRINSYLI